LNRLLKHSPLFIDFVKISANMADSGVFFQRVVYNKMKRISQNGITPCAQPGCFPYDSWLAGNGALLRCRQKNTGKDPLARGDGIFVPPAPLIRRAFER
jgi:hypothetical protein